MYDKWTMQISYGLGITVSMKPVRFCNIAEWLAFINLTKLEPKTMRNKLIEDAKEN